MFAELVAATESLKVAGQIAVGLIDLKTTTEVQSKAIELNQKILAAQHELFAANTAQAALIERVRDLESEITRMKDWETEKNRYQLATPYIGCLVYALKKAMSNGEPPHYICTRCYENGKRSILQTAPGAMNAYFCCPDKDCQMKAYSGWPGIGPLQYAEDVTAQ